MKDNFSQQAEAYANYRPAYPLALFDFVLPHIKQKNIAWDCATGNGQTALELARHFEKVLATDISRKQLERAPQATNIFYSVQPAEKTIFDDNSIDLITVSQALHWLSWNEFYSEVKRVARPGAWIAAWMYALPKISPAIDELITVDFYKNKLGTWWDEERKYVDENYTTIPFPFDEIKCPLFFIEVEWTLTGLSGYLSSWSAVQKFIAVHHDDPVGEIIQKIKPLWDTTTRTIRFPVYLRMGRIDK